MTRTAMMPNARKRARTREPHRLLITKSHHRRPAHITDLPDLALARLTALLDPVSLARLQCATKHALVPPDAICDAMRATLDTCGSLPPPAITQTWDVPAWLLHAHMALVTSEQPREAQELETYLARGAPSQYKLLRLEQDATWTWRIQGYCISENLDIKREHDTALRSLDLSTLFCWPFPGFEDAPRGFPLEHLRLSTAVDPVGAVIFAMPMLSLFANAPGLRCLEIVPSKQSPWFGYAEADFPLQALCWGLIEALDSVHAPGLQSLDLDFSDARTPVRPEMRELLEAAIAKRRALTHVALRWPDADSL